MKEDQNRHMMCEKKKVKFRKTNQCLTV